MENENDIKETHLKCDIYEPKNILLTGGAGFIGSHVAIHLAKSYPQCQLVVLDNLDYNSNMKNLEEIKDLTNFIFVQGDITDFDTVNNVFKSHAIDTVLHFAAQSHVDLSVKYSLKFTHVNVIGTHVLLENSRLNNIRRFIHVSTDEVYGSTDQIPDPNQPLEPTNPYACSKLAAECIVMAYRKYFQMPIIISRGNNVYGPHQFLEKVIPNFIFRLLDNKKCLIHGDGESERDFLYISDVVNAFDHLLKYGRPDEIYNISSTHGIKIKDLAKKIIHHIKNVKEGEEDEFIEYVADRNINDIRYKVDGTKIRSLGWDPKIDFDKGLQLTINWYTNNRDYWKISDITLFEHN
ncbi:unnamed protein product [Brachionus calyciflorus]|uniref:dTDP-D-glucose 4,6-dehydratase n=1 Tax=Brachionus calyciflorus TaxID=104777 RepID=A0A814GZ36_9BILA|nr:unnamed protein product [Brachionus calyciflorus]